MEPLLVEDLRCHGQVPKIVESIFNVISKGQESVNRVEFLAGLFYLLALECGYVPEERKIDYEDAEFSYSRVHVLSKVLPCNWKRNQCFQMNLVLAGLDDVWVLSVIPLPEDVLFSIATPGAGASYNQMVIDPLLYLTTSNTNVSLHHLQNLHHLSRIVKDELLHPCKVENLREHNLPYVGLEELPPEIIRYIATFLCLRDLARMDATSTHMFTVLHDLRLHRGVPGTRDPLRAHAQILLPWRYFI